LPPVRPAALPVQPVRRGEAEATEPVRRVRPVAAQDRTIPVTPRRETARGPERSAARPAPAVPAARRDDPERAAPPPIEVTIGRIEVRLVSASSPAVPRRPARPAPALSLEEYLRLREGGRR
jgi:hypothetical protein